LTVSLTNSGGTTTTTQSFGIVQEDPNETALVTLSGNAVEGQTVTATVNEPDAPATGILYTFQTSTDGVNWTTVQSQTDVNTYAIAGNSEGQLLRVVVSFPVNAITESGTSTAVTVQELSNDLTATISAAVTEGSSISVTGITDDNTSVAFNDPGIRYQ